MESATTVNTKNRRKSHASTMSEIKSIESELVEAVSENTATTSKRTSVDFTKPEIRSYREKIRERFRLMKEQVATTPKRAKPANYEQILKLMKQENAAIEDSLNKYQTERKCSSADAYNFFCENINTEYSMNDEELQDTQQEDKDKLTKIAAPLLLQEFVEIAYEEKLWRPPKNEVPLQMKINEDPRILEEEGLYVCEAPKVAYNNLLESRLLSSEDTKWFNCEGILKLADNPQLNSSFKPEQSVDVFETSFILPYQDGIVKDTPTVLISKSNILLLSISTLKFEHHPLFSLEHVFQQKLLFYYEKYHEKISSNKLEAITKRLESLRKLRDRALLNGSGENVNQYLHMEEIKKMRNSQVSESAQLREITKYVLVSWKNIKAIRKKNSYSNTNVSLTIYKEKVNYSEDVEKQRDDIENMIAEMTNEAKFDYEQKLSKHKEELSKWKQDKSKEKRPKKPSLDIDEDDIRHDVLSLFKDAFRPPGEPILTFKIATENEITKEIDENNENLRRQAVKSTKLYLKVFYNNIEVCKSKSIQMNDKFQCFFNESMSLTVSDMPDRVTVEIYESALSKRKVAEICLKVPHTNNRCREQDICDNFCKEELIHYKHEGVGSGRELEHMCKSLELNIAQNIVLNTCGTINYNISWQECNVSETIDRATMHDHILDENGKINARKLAEWTETFNVDPQNPNNIFVFEYIEAGLHKEVVHDVTKVQFRCNPDLQKLFLYSPEKINSNIRFQVLQLRNKNEPEFLGMYVPNRLKEIPANILTSHNQKRKHERTLSAESEDDNIDMKRSRGIRCLKQIHTKVYQQCRSAPNNLTYENIVNERLISYFQNWIRAALFNFLNWFKIRPGMNKPLPKLASEQPTEQILAPTIDQAASKIIVQVLSATNIPHKILVKKQNRTRSTSEILEEPRVYVEICYETMTLSTSIQEGTNPKWNEKLIFPLRSRHIDYLNPNALSGFLTINIWNENGIKVTDAKINDWLGNIKIQLSSIAHIDKLSGFFRVNSPLFLNYEHHIIHIQLNVWIEPAFPKLSLDLEDISTSEPAYLHKHVFQWNKIYNTNYPHRQFSAMAIDYFGKTVCLTRFIKPLEPPQTNQDDFETTPEQCARYVQLIPFIDCNKLYNSVSLCTEEILKLSTGTSLDHAITLTCYLLASNIETWLMLGHGVPNGQSAYVLMRENGQNNEINHYIFDVTSSTKYNVMDPLCPLQKIFCVINDENIWANTQRTNELNLTQFDFSRRSDWSPLFNTQVSAPTISIQKKVNYYHNNITEALEMQLETKLKKKIMKFRRTVRTIWNHTLSNYFKQHMQNLESNYSHTKYDISQLRNTDHTQQIHGFIIDLPYYNLVALFETIKSSRIFCVDTPSKEFVFALHLHQYPNDIFAVWMLIGFVLTK